MSDSTTPAAWPIFLMIAVANLLFGLGSWLARKTDENFGGDK